MVEWGQVNQRAAGFPGATETFCVAEGMEFVESRYTKPTRMSCHSHDTASIHVILQGNLLNRSDGGTTSGSVAQVAFLPAYTPHETQWFAGGVGFAVAFDANKASEWYDWGLVPGHPVDLEPGLVSALLVAVRREIFTGHQAGIIGAESYLLEAIAELMRRPHPGGEREGRSQRLLQARQLLHEASEPLPTLTQLARQVEVHPVYLARAFRHAFGETVGDCIRRRRIEASCHLIAKTGKTLCQVALEVGFADQAHFTRTFKQYLGIVPTEYARAVKAQKGSRPG